MIQELLDARDAVHTPRQTSMNKRAWKAVKRWEKEQHRPGGMSILACAVAAMISFSLAAFMIGYLVGSGFLSDGSTGRSSGTAADGTYYGPDHNSY